MSFGKVDNKFPSLRITFNDKLYDFKVIHQKRSEGFKVEAGNDFYDYPILVQSGEKFTNIGSSGEESGEDYVAVAWIGNLDHDGNLDLITYVVGSNYSGYCVWLSSAAKGSQLFGAKQCHISSGC
jgi:hypothetical protein